MVVLSAPLFAAVSVYWYYNKPNPQYQKGCPISIQVSMVGATAIYYALVFNLAPKYLDKKYPLLSETKTVCEVKTTYWRQGITSTGFPNNP